MASREGRQPLSVALYGISQAVLTLAMVPNLLPKPARALAILFASWVAYKIICFETTGVKFGDLGFGSVIVHQLLIAVDVAFATPISNFEELVDKNPIPIEARSFKERLIWATKLYSGTRGIGWAHEPQGLSSRPQPTMSPRQFIVHKLSDTLIYLLLGCVAFSFLVSNPALTTAGLPPSETPLLWRAFAVPCFVITAFYTINITHTIGTILAVASGFSLPHEWPDLFGSPLDAWSLQRFWRKTWHQNVRKSCTGCASMFTSLLPAPTTPTKRWMHKLTRLYLVFFLAGFAHTGGERMMTGRLTSSTLKLFMLQPVGICIERIVVSLWPYFTSQSARRKTLEGEEKTKDRSNGHHKIGGDVDVGGYGNVGLRGTGSSAAVEEDPALWIRVVGMAWVIAWGIFTVPYYLDIMCAVGAFSDPRYTYFRIDWIFNYLSNVPLQP